VSVLRNRKFGWLLLTRFMLALQPAHLVAKFLRSGCVARERRHGLRRVEIDHLCDHAVGASDDPTSDSHDACFAHHFILTAHWECQSVYRVITEEYAVIVPEWNSAPSARTNLH
jgi:hypothetical protein